MGDAIKVYNNGECAFGKVSEGQGHTRRIMLIEGISGFWILLFQGEQI